MFRSSEGSLALVIALCVTCVVIILAFFFTVPPRGPYVMDGLPHNEETSRVWLSQTNGYPVRLDNSTRREDQQPQAVRENGLSEVGNRL